MSQEEQANYQMLVLDMHQGLLAEIQFPKVHGGDHGGWMMKRNWEGIRRRLSLPAVMREGIFVFAMGGTHFGIGGHAGTFKFLRDEGMTNAPYFSVRGLILLLYVLTFYCISYLYITSEITFNNATRYVASAMDSRIGLRPNRCPTALPEFLQCRIGYDLP